MPIDFPLTLPRLSTEEMRDLDYRVMAHAFESHKDLGRLCDEKIYQADLARRLESDDIGMIRREFPLKISFRDFFAIYVMDLIVGDRVIYELKTSHALSAAHTAQLLNYLFLCDFNRGKLINFRLESVESRFVNSTLTAKDRKNFTINTTHWIGDEIFLHLITDLLRDWGTSLEISLYRNAVIHLLGGEAMVNQSIPLFKDNTLLGNQTFSLYSPDTAFTITSMTKDISSHTAHLQRLLKMSRMKRFFWVNIILGQIEFRTISI